MDTALDHEQNKIGDEESGARELGLQNNLRQTEVQTLVEYYKKKDPNNVGLPPEQFKEASGSFIAKGLTVDPMTVFNIFDTAEDGIRGRVTMREFILGYAILCRGSTENRLMYLFSIYKKAEEKSFLTRDQLISALKLMHRIVSEVSDEGIEETDSSDTDFEEVADQLLTDSGTSDKNKISYDDFIEQLGQSDVVTEWLDKLSTVTGDHLKFIEERELQLVELNMQREGILGSEASVKGGKIFLGDAISSSLSNQAGSSSASSNQERKRKLPMPRRQKLVRRDISKNTPGQNSPTSKQIVFKQNEQNYEDQDVNTAMSFLVNYEHINFGKILGRGGCATVYQCEWMHLPVAVKVFNDVQGEPADVDQLASSHEEGRKLVVGDYVEEFWLLLQIRHPNCLLYLGICFEPIVCIVTELYSGGSVENFLYGPNPKKFKPDKAIELIADVARGMYYLHASSPSILHRDLKASNILINRALSNCVICDFGLSSQFVNEASLLNLRDGGKSRDGGAMRSVGTPYTMAPEVMKGDKYTPAADVFSFGIVAYEMYTGRFPFPNMKPIQLMFHVSEGRRPVFYEDDMVPPILKDLIESCWAASPRDRPTFESILKTIDSQQLSKDIDQIMIAMNSRADTSDDLGSAGKLKDTKSTDSSKETSPIENISKRLLDLSFDGNDEGLLNLINQGANVDYSDYDKRTALHVASAEGRVECMRILLRAGASLRNDRWNNSPVFDALRYLKRTGNSEPVRLLRAAEDRNAETKVTEATPKILQRQPETSLQTHKVNCAVVEGDIESLRKLIDEGCDINLFDYDRRTPLMVAASEGNIEITKLLIRHGADINMRDRWGMSALQEAQRCGHHEIYLYLKNEQSGIDL